MRLSWIRVAAAATSAAAASMFAPPVRAQGASAPAHQAAGPAGGSTAGARHAERVTSVEGITEYRLPNGLRVLLFPDPSKATVTVNVTYMVGSRHEGYGETGMAHLLEHLQFKGTRGRHNIYAEMTKHGARWNASTWVDRTNYFEIMTSTPENIRWALDVEADRMVNSLIAKSDLASEMTVVRNEFEAGENDPFNILLERTISTAYLWHNYGHSTIGARSDIERVPIERLQAFYHKYYQPDNAVLLVAGKFDPQATLAAIEQRFGSIPRPTRTLARGNVLFETYTEEPTQDGERSVTLRRTGDVQLVMAGYHVPALSSPDFAAVDVLTGVLGDEPSGRLYQALVVPKLAASTGAFSSQYREPGILLAFAQVRADASLEAARSILLRTVDSARGRPPTTEEVERAKTKLLKQIDLLLNASDQVGLALSEWQAAGDWRLLFEHRDRLKKVTPADVQQAATRYLKASNVTVGLFYPTTAPDRSEIPGAIDIAALVKDYKGDTSLAVGEAFDPSPGTIDVRSRISRLPSGLHVSLLPKRTRGGTVHGRLELRFGTEASLTGRDAARELAAGMMDRGTTTLTRQQLRDSLDKLKARVNISGQSDRMVADIETVRANVPAVVGVVTDMLRRPRFETKDFEELKQERLAQLEQGKSDPTTLAFVELNRRLEPRPVGHPLYTPTVEEHIAGLSKTTLEDARRFHDDFYGGAAGDFVMVGDFDSAQVAQVVASGLGDWKAPQQRERIRDAFQRVDSSTTTIETPDKTNALFAAGLNVHLQDDDPDYPAFVMGDYVVGGGALDSRLANRIRQKEGLSYGVQSNLAVRSADSGGQWLAFAIHAPQNRDRVQAAFKEEIARVLKDGVTAAELERAKAAWLQDRQQARSNDDELVGLIDLRREYARTFAYDAELEGRVRAVTVEQVNAAIRKYIAPDGITIVRAGDFDKTAPGGLRANPPTP